MAGGAMQPCKVALPVAEKEEGCQQEPEQLKQFEEGRCQANRVQGIYAAFIHEVGWTGGAMAERNTGWEAGKSPSSKQRSQSSHAGLCSQLPVRYKKRRRPR